jgi:hypothetical protein
MANSPGPVRLGELKIFLPDASAPDFWFAHDIAGLLGTEFNAEAWNPGTCSTKRTTGTDFSTKVGRAPRARLCFRRRSGGLTGSSTSVYPSSHTHALETA